jgi:hypothetical protein
MEVLTNKIIKPDETLKNANIKKLRKELEKMLREKKHSYEEILKKSQELDEYIVEVYKTILH